MRILPIYFLLFSVRLFSQNDSIENKIKFYVNEDSCVVQNDTTKNYTPPKFPKYFFVQIMQQLSKTLKISGDSSSLGCLRFNIELKVEEDGSVIFLRGYSTMYNEFKLVLTKPLSGTFKAISATRNGKPVSTILTLPTRIRVN
jgi:hypothetical protein